jgi:carbon-monoxide dehydrogenase small subunit
VVNSCQLLAPQVDGREVITIEGIGDAGGGPSDLQLAFLEFGAVQCGYCTPGMVVAAEAFLARQPNPAREEIRVAISGNLCRCTGYQQIVDAIEATAARRQSQAEGRRP